MLSTRTKINIASTASKLIRSFGGIIGIKDQGVYKRKGVKWDLNLKDGIDFAIFLQGSFEPEILRLYKKFIKRGYCVLDIGANVGAHTLHFAKAVGPKGKVIAFEPTNHAFGKMKKNLSLNPELAPRVNAVQALLIGDSSNNIPEKIPSRWPLDSDISAAHPVHLGVYESISNAKAFRLDDWVSENLKAPIDFIKIDVDGFEIEVLQGAANTLKVNNPLIVMEFAPYVFEERGFDFNQLLKIISSYGYSCSDTKGRTLELNESILSGIPKDGSINVVLYKSGNPTP